MLTELDKKIGALKGLRYYDPRTGKEKSLSYSGVLLPLSEGFLFDRDGVEHHIEAWACAWSTDDAKALELVDELVDGPPRAPLELLLLSETPTARWLARFYMTGKQYQDLCSGVGPTRPEAICRAYIAAMEWMRDRRA